MPHVGLRQQSYLEQLPILFRFWWDDMFTAKVKSTGEVFMATNELTSDGILSHDAHQLEAGKMYGGLLLRESWPGNPPLIEFTDASWASFEAEQLEALPGDMRLRRVRR